LATVKTIKPAGGGDYTTLQAWEDWADGESNADQTAECYTGDLGVITFAGWTATPTVALHPIIIGASGNRHDGTNTVQGARIVSSAAAITQHNFRYLEIEGLFFDFTGNVKSCISVFNNVANTTVTCKVNQIVLKRVNGSHAQSCGINGESGNWPSGPRPVELIITNSYFQNAVGGGNQSAAIRTYGVDNNPNCETHLTVINCTVHTSSPSFDGRGIQVAGNGGNWGLNSTTTMYNTAVYGQGDNRTLSIDGGTNTGSHNATSDGRATTYFPTSSIINRTAATDFTSMNSSPAVKTTGGLYQTGKNTSAEGVTKDIIGTSRFDAYEIGAWEVYKASSSSSKSSSKSSSSSSRSSSSSSESSNSSRSSSSSSGPFPCPDICVSGAGNTDVNGNYTWNGTRWNGPNGYYMLSMFGQYFAIVGAASDPDNYEWEYYYYEDPISECPPETGWNAFYGAGPAPTLTLTACASSSSSSSRSSVAGGSSSSSSSRSSSSSSSRSSSSSSSRSSSSSSSRSSSSSSKSSSESSSSSSLPNVSSSSSSKSSKSSKSSSSSSSKSSSSSSVSSSKSSSSSSKSSSSSSSVSSSSSSSVSSSSVSSSSVSSSSVSSSSSSVSSSSRSSVSSSSRSSVSSSSRSSVSSSSRSSVSSSSRSSRSSSSVSSSRSSSRSSSSVSSRSSQSSSSSAMRRRPGYIVQTYMADYIEECNIATAIVAEIIADAIYESNIPTTIQQSCIVDSGPEAESIRGF